MSPVYSIAARNLLRHPRRTFFLGGAIAIVTAVLVLVMGVSSGAQAILFRSATTLTSGHLNVIGFYKVMPGQSTTVMTHYPDVVKAVRDEMPEIDYVAERPFVWNKVISETGTLQLDTYGVDLDQDRNFAHTLSIAQGRLDDLRKPNTLLLFEDEARKLNVKVGDTVTLATTTMRGAVNTADVQLVAIARSVGMLSSVSCFIPESTARTLSLLKADASSLLLIYLKDIGQLPSAEAHLRKVLSGKGYRVMPHDGRVRWMKLDTINNQDWTGQKLDITTWEDEVSLVKWVLIGLRVLGVVLVLIMMVVVAIGLMNASWIAIRERTREIGTMRAIGMTRRQVLTLFTVEGALVGVLGSMLGSLVGMAISLAVNRAAVQVPDAAQLILMSDRLHVLVQPGGLLFAIALIVGTTTAISLASAFKAARVTPVEALAQVG